MSRPHDWPERLSAFVARARSQEWQWGVHDCCSFARGAVLAVGGPDLGRDWAGAYQDEDGAHQAIKALGRNLEAAMDTVCRDAGLQEVQPATARRGDLLVLVDRQQTKGLPLAAVCVGRDAMAAARRGMLTLPMRMCVRAWAVE